MKISDNASRSLRGEPSSAFTTGISAVLTNHFNQTASTREAGFIPKWHVELGKLRMNTDCCRAFWKGQDVGLTLGEYKIVHLLASRAATHVSYRTIYDCLHREGFLAGYGPKGYQANVRSAIKRIRKKFCACDPTFDEIGNHPGLGYCWQQPDQ